MGKKPGAEVCQNTLFEGTPVFGRRAKGNGAETNAVSTPFLEVESVDLGLLLLSLHNFKALLKAFVAENDFHLVFVFRLGHFALAVAATEEDIHAADFSLLVFVNIVTADGALNLLGLFGLYKLGIGSHRILGRVLLEFAGAVLAAEKDLLAVIIRGRRCLGGTLRIEHTLDILQIDFVPSPNGNRQDHDRNNR